MELEELLKLEAKCYVALAEIDYDLVRWHRRHYSPSLAMARGILHNEWSFRRSMRAFASKMKEFENATLAP